MTRRLALLLACAGFASGQQAHVNLDYNPQKNTRSLTPYGANVISPEVRDDHTVIFRVKAPAANEVLLTGGPMLLALKAAKPLPFKKGDDGVWTLTVGPVKPNMYVYKFVIDGVTVPDPNNTVSGFADQPPYSELVVHGDTPAYYDARNVPHGAVTRHIYHSDVTQGEREIYVYTPPGYDSAKKYPVVYLLGGSGELASTWALDGRANFIMDNLLAEGKALPMIIAMPNNQVVHRTDPKHTELTFPLFEAELRQAIVPFVEKHYSVRADRHGRALAGLSMGGRHTQFVGFRCLDLFASFGVLSAGDVDTEKSSAEFLNNPDVNKKIDYLFVGQGTTEERPGTRTVALRDALAKHGIKHEYYVGGDGGHDWGTWRHLLYARFLPGLWRENKASANQQVSAKVNELLARMTLDEKIGQLTQLGGLPLIPDPVKVEERIRKGQVGSILWLSEPVAINRLQRIAMEESRLKIPLLFGLDVIHGFRTVLPIPLAMAASWDPQLTEKGQEVAAREARAAGLHWTFAPMVDIARDPRWGRIIEGAGEDPFLGASMAGAQVRGLQGPDIASGDRVIACVKHFAGYGAADGGRDYDAANVPEELLRNVYLPPFEAAHKAGAATFMSAYMDLNDVPATGNRFLLKDVLRRDWGFDGFVVSDAKAVGDLTTHGFARDGRDAAARALMAGVDMDMASRTYLTHLSELVKSGKVTESAVDDAVRSILAVKFRMGLFEHPYAEASRMTAILNAPEHREVARRAAQRSAVLLRNEGSLLPLSKQGRSSIAVIGPLGDSGPDLLGSWIVKDHAAPAVSIVEGIRAKLGSAVRVEFAQGAQIRKPFTSMLDDFMGLKQADAWTDARAKSEFDKAVELARRSELVVMTMGELASMSGEMASKSTLDLPGRQQQLMEALVATGKPVVLVLVNGRPLNLTWASANVPAILEAWHPGTEGGNAIADLLFGDATPGGKLPLTWPRSEGQIPIYYAHNLTHQPETDSDFKSRYWDIPSSPLYPFGFGLSYTTFRYSNLQVEVGASEVSVDVDVQNTGSRTGEEVIQLYIHQQAGSASRPVRQLRGFARLPLAAGAKKTFRFRLGKDELSYWNPNERAWVQEAGPFDIWVGGDSTASLHTTVVPKQQ